jgi:DNA-binding NarL/FixJ family response regulator
MIRVAMVEDHPLTRQGFRDVLSHHAGMRVVAAVERIEDLLQVPETADVVLLDLGLPSPLSGLVGVRFLADRGFRVLVLTGQAVSMVDVADAMAAGAQGYLTKDASVSEYVPAITAVASGHGHLGARLAAFARVESDRLERTDPNRLTAREAEVAGLMAEGYTNGEIADMLHLSERTVDGHLENIKDKLCESRRVRVAIKVRELGYIPPPDQRWTGDT